MRGEGMVKQASIVILLAAGLMGGCASTSLNLGEYKSVPLKPASVMPTKAELSGAPLKAVIFPLTDKQLRIGAQAQVGQTIADVVQSVLSKAGVEILDRSLYGELKNEIALTEIKGTTGYQGPQEADFAIVGNVSMADYSHSFTEARTWQGKDGKLYRSPPSCSFHAGVTGNLNIYRLPSLQMVKSININATANSSREARYSICKLSKVERSSLIRQAASEAVIRSRTQLQNYFAPRGYVLARREDKNHNSIFEISLGAIRGAKQGEECDFYHTILSKNALTNKTTTDEYIVAKGTVSSGISPNHAWVVIKDKHNIDQIHLGDKVKFHYTTGFLEEFTQTIGDLTH